MSAYDFGGGGFMANSSPRTGSQGSPGGERRAASQALRPMTIKQVLKAEQAHTDAELYIDGHEVAQVTVVAQIVNMSQQTTNKVYVLEDGTGRVEARVWTDSSIDDSEMDDQDKLGDGSYVRVTGVLKHFSNKRYINATNIRPVKDAHELYFHLMEAMYVTLVLRRGPPSGHDDAGERSGVSPGQTNLNGAAKSDYSHYTSHAVSVGNDQYAEVSPLARRIVEFIVAQPKNEQGVHVAKIAREVKADAGAISAALDELMDNGHVFSTIDESHFAASG